MNKKYLLILSAGHAFTDMNQGALPAMLPFLIAAGGLKYSQAAGLTFALALSSTLVQPLFGIMADRLSKSWLLPLGVLLGGTGMALIGFFSGHYWLMFAFAVLSGLGIASYHPESARTANQLAGKNKGGSMSIYSVGGNIGFFLGPIIITPAILNLGLRGSALLALPAITMCVMLTLLAPKIYSRSRLAEKSEAKTDTARKNEWGKFIWLGISIIARSIVNHSMNTFFPLYWINVLHESKAASGMVLSFMFFCSAVATLLGGHLSDRFGLNNILKISWVLSIPSVFLLTRATNPVFAVLLLIPYALGNYMLNTPMVILGQKYLPAHLGFASGVTLGLGVSVGGMVTPLLGKYADIHGLEAAMGLLAILPVIGILVALTLKPPKEQ